MMKIGKKYMKMIILFYTKNNNNFYSTKNNKTLEKSVEKRRTKVRQNDEKV